MLCVEKSDFGSCPEANWPLIKRQNIGHRSYGVFPVWFWVFVGTLEIVPVKTVSADTILFTLDFFQERRKNVCIH